MPQTLNIIRPYSSLKKTAEERKPGYLEACLKLKVTGSGNDRMIEFTSEEHARIGREYRLDKPIPSLAQRIKNAAGAVGDLVREGITVRTEVEQFKILEICKGGDGVLPCPEYRGDGKCAKCGCNLNLKKRLAAWHCPLNKW